MTCIASRRLIVKFIVFFLIANWALYLHWTSSAAQFRSATVEALVDFGPTDTNRTSLKNVDSMDSGVKYVTNLIAQVIAESYELNKTKVGCAPLCESLSRFGFASLQAPRRTHY